MFPNPILICLGWFSFLWELGWTTFKLNLCRHFWLYSQALSSVVAFLDQRYMDFKILDTYCQCWIVTIICLFFYVLFWNSFKAIEKLQEQHGEPFSLNYLRECYSHVPHHPQIRYCVFHANKIILLHNQQDSHWSQEIKVNTLLVFYSQSPFKFYHLF